MTKVLYFAPAHLAKVQPPVLLDLPEAAAVALVAAGSGAYPVNLPLDRLPAVVIPFPTPTPTPEPTPAPSPSTFAAVAIAQPASMAASWHEMHPILSPDGSAVHFHASDEAGNARSLKINALTGTILSDKLYNPRVWLMDDHHAMSETRLFSGVGLLAMCGHANRYASGATVNEIVVFRSLNGTFEGYATERSAGPPNVVVITLPTTRIPNYLQIYQVPQGLPNAGMVVLKYNDDATATMVYITSTDDGLTWQENRPHMSRASSGWGGSVPQLYARDDWEAMYTGLAPVTGTFSGTFVPSYGYLHPNCPGGAQCRFNWLDITTGKIYSPINGNPLNSGASAFTTGSIGAPIGSLPPAENPVAKNVRVPATGRTQRVNYVSLGVVYTTDMTVDPDYANGRHMINKAVNGVRQDFDVGPSGVAFWQSSGYMPDLQPGYDPHTGDLAYRVSNDGTSKSSGGKLERMHWPNGIENGNPIVQTIWEAGKNGVAADVIAARFFPVRGAKSTGVVGFLQTFTRYARYDDWSGGQLFAIVRS